MSTTRWVITLAAFSMMSGMTVDWQTLPRLLDTDTLWKWAPGAVYGLVLLFVLRRFGSVITVLWSIVGVTLVYHLVLLGSRHLSRSSESGGAARLGIPDGGLWPAAPHGGPSETRSRAPAKLWDAPLTLTRQGVEHCSCPKRC